MLNNEIFITPSLSNNAPVARKLTVSGASATDANVPTNYAWKITSTGDGYDYIWQEENGVKYYIRSVYDSGDNHTLVYTTNPNDTGTKWSFNKYTGSAIDGITLIPYTLNLDHNSTFDYNAYMYSSTIGRNGPVSYSVVDTDDTETNRATINSSTGEITTSNYGKIKLKITYSGSPWVWIYYVSIGGTFVNEVPTNIRSTPNHLCIPCAITNIAAHWCIKNNLTQFGCATADTQNTTATSVHNAMAAAGGAGVNNNIQYGFDIFSHTENGVTTTLQSTNYWKSENNGFGWDLIVSEINAGRPVMLGFLRYPVSEDTEEENNSLPHMTVCVGYRIEGNIRHVYLSDAHDPNYQIETFDESYSDFIATVNLITE